MSKELRNKIIRLAHSNPELRKDLLPLLSKTAESKFKKGDTVKYKGKECKVVEVASNGKITIKAKGGGAVKTFSAKDAEKQLKTAKTNTESLLRAKEISIKGLGIYVVVGVDKTIGDLFLREMGGRKEYTLSIMVSGSLMSNGAELKGRGSTRMRTQFIQGKDITVISTKSSGDKTAGISSKRDAFKMLDGLEKKIKQNIKSVNSFGSHIREIKNLVPMDVSRDLDKAELDYSVFLAEVSVAIKHLKEYLSQI